MSRTYRRKNSNRSYQNYESAEEFYFLKELSDAGNPRPRPVLDKTGRYWNHNAVEWRNYTSAMYFNKYSYGKQTFEEWLAAEKAMYHSDAGYGNRPYRRAPGWFVSQFCQRPFRSRCKQVLRVATLDESWDGMVLPPYIHDAAWKYD